MMPPLRSFDDVEGKERGQKKTDDLRAMTTLGPRAKLQSTRAQEITVLAYLAVKKCNFFLDILSDPVYWNRDILNYKEARSPPVF